MQKFQKQCKAYVAKRGKHIIRVAEDFAGIGGGSLAVEKIVGPQNTNNVMASEIDQQTRAVYLASHGVKSMSADIRCRDTEKMPHADIYLAGSPCGHYAPGGKGDGERSADGELFFEPLK